MFAFCACGCIKYQAVAKPTEAATVQVSATPGKRHSKASETLQTHSQGVQQVRPVLPVKHPRPLSVEDVP